MRMLSIILVENNNILSNERCTTKISMSECTPSKIAIKGGALQRLVWVNEHLI